MIWLFTPLHCRKNIACQSRSFNHAPVAHSRAGVQQQGDHRRKHAANRRPESVHAIAGDCPQTLQTAPGQTGRLLFKNQRIRRLTFTKTAPDTSLGIIACGLAYNYLMENWQEIESRTLF